MTKYYRNKHNDLIYWVQDDVVLCDDDDMCDTMPSAFTLAEFEEALLDTFAFEEVMDV